jgi:GTP-binding protein
MLSFPKHFLKSSKQFHIFLKRECSTTIQEDIVKPRHLPKRVLNIALVGRPNTGKSTLFNRLTGKKLAIVSPVPGTTRDRKQGKGSIAGLSINVIDTGGLDDRGAVSINIQNQVEHALREADVILFMIDAKVGVSTIDEFFGKWLRKKLGSISKNVIETIPYNNNNNKNNNINPVINELGDQKDENDEDKNDRNIVQQEDIDELNFKNLKKRDVFVIANKTEGAHLSNRVLDTISDALRLGLGEPIPISASHGDGMADLAQHFIAAAKSRGLDDGDDVSIKERCKTPITLEERVIQLAIMGKPNVGKSTLVNSFIGQDRLIVGPTAGLTRYCIIYIYLF